MKEQEKGAPEPRGPEVQLQPAGQGVERIDRTVHERIERGPEPGKPAGRKLGASEVENKPRRKVENENKPGKDKSGGGEVRRQRREVSAREAELRQREIRVARKEAVLLLLPHATPERRRQLEEELQALNQGELRDTPLPTQGQLEAEQRAREAQSNPRRPWYRGVRNRLGGFIPGRRRPRAMEQAPAGTTVVKEDGTGKFILGGVLGGIIVAGILGAANCKPGEFFAPSGRDGETPTPRAQATPTPSEAGATPKPDATPTPRPTPKIGESPTLAVGPKRTARPEEAKGTTGFIEDRRIENVGVTVVGTPEKVAMSTIDIAKGVFKNTLGHGSEAFLAEPGGLLVGPDFESASTNKNPYGANPAGWAKMWETEGQIEPFSPVTQEVLRTYGPNGEAWINLREGGFIKLSAGQMRVEIDGRVFDMKGKPGRNYFFIARGLYPDAKQDSDLNRTAMVTNYKAGHILVEEFSSGKKTNKAFLSEGQFLQTAETSHSHSANCGAEGCSELVVVFYDRNTENWAIMRQVQGRFQDASKGWESVASNWDPNK